MKYYFLIIVALSGTRLCAQSLQLHYDLKRDFPTVFFDYYKNRDTVQAARSLGPFLLKMQADLNGERNNISQIYVQVFQQLRLWNPKFYIILQYTGGLGVTNPRQYSYFIPNTWSAGISVPFKIGSAYLSAELDYRLTALTHPSHDPSCTLYFWKGLWRYRIELSGDITVWAQNRDNENGKQVQLFAEPQLWFRISNSLATGSKINIYHHVLRNDNSTQLYPTVALRVKL